METLRIIVLDETLEVFDMANLVKENTRNLLTKVKFRTVQKGKWVCLQKRGYFTIILYSQ